jgi:hypothetical protein
MVSQKKWRLNIWHTIALFGFLLMVVYALGTYFFDFFAGTATIGFGKMGDISGTGMFFIYMIGYFLAIVVILPILLFKRFGIGTMIFVPYAVFGFFVEYYYEWYSVQVLKSIWAVFGWSAMGLFIGLSADFVIKFLPEKVSLMWKAISAGAVIGIVNFILTLIALMFFYEVPLSISPVESGSFLGVAYFCLPWLIVNSGFGGYTAYAIHKGFKI